METLLLFKNKGLDTTFNVISKTALFGTLFEICSHFVTLFSEKKVLNILFDVEKDVYSVSATSSSEEKKNKCSQEELNLWPSGYYSRCSTTQVQKTDQWRIQTFRSSDKRGGVGGGGGGWGRVSKSVFWLFGPQFYLKIIIGPLLWIHHCW